MTKDVTGTVKFFSDSKGYGFITMENNVDVFVHYTQIMTDGFKTLAEGQKVTFDVVKGEKGLQSSNVRREV